MRRLLLLLVVAALVPALVAVANLRLDPFGLYYGHGATEAAIARGCLVSDDLIGSDSWRPFKEHLFRIRGTRIAVVGTSRVLEVRSHAGERGFTNLGLPGTGIETLGPLFRRLHEARPGPLTLYLGVELFWLNRTWTPSVAFGRSRRATLRSLFSAQNFERSFALFLDRPASLVHGWHVDQVGGRCVLDRASRVADGRKSAWEPDGSFRYNFELVPASRTKPDDDFTRDLVAFDGAYYSRWRELDAPRLRLLDEALVQARSYGWQVVGYTPPYSRRYVERLSTATETAQPSRAFRQTVADVFRRHGFSYLDLRAVADVPCADAAFVDDGWHPDAACSARIRERLDAAAGL